MSRVLRVFFIPCKENDFKPRILESQFFFMLLGLLVGIKILSLISFSSFLGADIFNQVSQGDLYSLTNKARIENGVDQLKVSSRLEAVAQLKLADMFQNSYFAHTSPAGVTPWDWFDKANYNYQLAGENLAMNFLSSQEVLKAWLNSESHRKNLLLKDFKEIGIAVGSGIINGQKTIVVVQEFGTSRASIISVPAVKNPKVTPTAKPVVVKSKPISLKQVAIAKPAPQVKSASTQKIATSEYKGYFINKSAENAMIVFAMAAFLILFLKVFVAFRIQFPSLILRSVLLIIISLGFILVKDDHFFASKLKITSQAEISTHYSK